MMAMQWHPPNMTPSVLCTLPKCQLSDSYQDSYINNNCHNTEGNKKVCKSCYAGPRQGQAEQLSKSKNKILASLSVSHCRYFHCDITSRMIILTGFTCLWPEGFLKSILRNSKCPKLVMTYGVLSAHFNDHLKLFSTANLTYLRKPLVVSVTSVPSEWRHFSLGRPHNWPQQRNDVGFGVCLRGGERGGDIYFFVHRPLPAHARAGRAQGFSSFVGNLQSVTLYDINRFDDQWKWLNFHHYLRQIIYL